MIYIEKFMAKKEGYTLLEIVICIIIISIVSRIVVFSVTQIEKRNLNNDVVILKSVIEEIQTSAIFTNRVHGIYFLNEKEYYSYMVDDYNQEIILMNYSFNKDNFLLYNNLYENRINFTKRGTITRACSMEVSSKNFKVRLAIEVGSGNLNLYGVENKNGQ